MNPSRSVSRRLATLVAAAGAMVAISATVFGGGEGVDPRGLLLAIGLVAAVVPVSQLARQLPIDRDDVPRGDERILQARADHVQAGIDQVLWKRTPGSASASILGVAGGVAPP